MCSVLSWPMEWLFKLAPESRGMSGVFFSSVHPASAQLVFSEENPIFAQSAASPCLQAQRNVLRMMHQSFQKTRIDTMAGHHLVFSYLLCGRRFHWHMPYIFLDVLGECRCCDESSRTCR